MLKDFLHFLIVLENYKYIVIFPIAIFEGPVVSITSGFLVSLGALNGIITYIVLVCGDLLGDSMYYLIGKYWGNSSWANKVMRPLGYNKEVENSVQDYFQKHKGKTLILAKMSYGLGAASEVAAGFAKVKFGEFFFLSLAGTLPKSLILLLIGFYAGHSYVKITSYLNIIPYFTILFAVVLVIIYIALSKSARKFFSSVDRKN